MSAIGPFVAALEHLAASRSAAVTVTSSLAGLVPSPLDPLYAAAKHALVGLVRSLAPAYPDIRINAVCPALVRTPMIDHPGPSKLPLLEPEDVAHQVVRQLTGHTDGEVLFMEADTHPRDVPAPLLSSIQRT